MVEVASFVEIPTKIRVFMSETRYLPSCFRTKLDTTLSIFVSICIFLESLLYKKKQYFQKMSYMIIKNYQTLRHSIYRFKRGAVNCTYERQ